MVDKVFCYRNLARKGIVWSVKSCKTGLVSDRVGFIFLVDAELIVSQAGRKRVLRDGRKNVHAGVRGFPMDYPSGWVSPSKGWRRVQYNPYQDKGFVYSRTGKLVGKVSSVALTQSGCWVLK